MRRFYAPRNGSLILSVFDCNYYPPYGIGNHITQTIAGNTLVTEQPQHSSMITSSRITKISANGLIYNDLHRNQCDNFHIPNILDFLWDDNSPKGSLTFNTIRICLCSNPATPVTGSCDLGRKIL